MLPPALLGGIVSGASNLIGGLFGQMAEEERRKREAQLAAAKQGMEASMGAAQRQYGNEASGLAELMANYRAALGR